MPFVIVEQHYSRPRRLARWIGFKVSQTPVPRRCMECRKLTTGNVEGITKIRFDLCDQCIEEGWVGF